MQRIAFRLRVKKDKLAEYDEAHRHVWPELIEKMEEYGVHEYSIFRRGQDLFLTLRVPNWEDTRAKLSASDVDKRWQANMAPLFEPVQDLADGETVAMMEEVFYMPGKQPE